jgi:hypothetical protein
MTNTKHRSASDAAPGTATWDATQRGPVRRSKDDSSGPDDAPRCLACFPHSVAGQMIPLRYGVTIALCPDHRDPAFVRSRGGRDFLAALTTTFASLGLHGARYRNALHAFVADVLAMDTPTPRRRPGSYAWPDQRRAAEAIWAAGGSYHDGAAAVLAHFTEPLPAVRPPSSHTIRRWWRERRWLTPRPAPPPRRQPAPLIDRRATTAPHATHTSAPASQDTDPRRDRAGSHRG